ncbi:glucosamine-6-phosphate deaminase [Leifsonia poae]|uniref:glucosamine-6-phosphate deaminase n=1 Tax=Leifsonia poae TaxID=110933 RepID=UPI001CC1A915|nr:glucosamine-6-phosphate deaminase [Leifsonia poae]
MEVIIVPGPNDVAVLAADIVARLIQQRPDAVLGLATGSSPLGLYAELARRAATTLDTTRVSGFALDEYVGLDPAHPQSYASVIRTQVTEPLGLDPARVQVPPGDATDLERSCAEFEQAIREAGGVDLQILGLGGNGHIGFNEPTSSFSSRTRIKTLAPATRRDNARFFPAPDDVPTHCVTQGLGTIMDATTVLLLAAGPAKADALAKAVEGPVAALCPASILQHHRRAIVLVDEEAAAGLALADYYRYAYANKPEWQRS